MDAVSLNRQMSEKGRYAPDRACLSFSSPRYARWFVPRFAAVERWQKAMSVQNKRYCLGLGISQPRILLSSCAFFQGLQMIPPTLGKWRASGEPHCIIPGGHTVIGLEGVLLDGGLQAWHPLRAVS